MRRQCLSKTTPALLSLVFALILYSLIGCSHHQKQHTAEQLKHEQHSPATQQRFSDIEVWVKRFEDPARDAWQKPAEVVKTMNVKPGDVVADIGAGTGYITRHIAVAVAPGGKAIGLDIEQSMVDYMREDARKLGLNTYEARVVKTDDPELGPASVDVVFLCNTYHHIENRAVYFRNLSRSLKPGGRIITIDFYKNTDFGPPRDHKLAKEVVLTEMKQAGYRLDKDLKFLEHQYYLEFVPE